ncbi:hypothetical protein GO495_29935 [Chitinophaga oryziterrae]|uniref:Uncharacterized protein n=1 Tax=Chitinophaga oryziterrae TaxID=1031224 RepID=A0A6N8JI17_9BACT|nr:hypothetical protein [Chitinophaga oryziterrae]MVT44850.1 hypothetical protein [Chitinophaga oryziterrae]
MGYNDHIDFELHVAIQDLIDEGLIDDKMDAAGVARQVIHSGYGSLSLKQKALYDAVIIPKLEKRGGEIEIIQRLNSWPE